MIFFVFSFAERFIDVLLSKVTRYYEGKFCMLVWLMFFQGADTIYRTARMAFKKLDKLAFVLLPSWPQQTEEEYIATLPRKCWPDATAMGVERFLRQFGCDADVTRLYGEGVLFQLWQLWNELDPRYLSIKLLHAKDLPAMDSNGFSDPFVVAYLVPPPMEEETLPPPAVSHRLDRVRRGSPSGKKPAAIPRVTSGSDLAADGGNHATMPRSKSWLDLFVPRPNEAAIEAARRCEVATKMQAHYRGWSTRKRSAWMTIRAANRQSSAIGRMQGMAYSFSNLRKALRAGQWRSLPTRLAAIIRNYWSGGHLAALRAAVSGGPVGARGQYGRTCSRVRRRTLDPVWSNEWLELQIKGGAVNEKGVYDNPAAPYTHLRLEVWDNDRLSHDDFIGEVGLPLIALMDARTHSYSMKLGDPEGKTSAEGGVNGMITFELKYET